MNAIELNGITKRYNGFVLDKNQYISRNPIDTNRPE